MAPEPPRPPADAPSAEHANRGAILTAEQLADRWQVPTSQVYRLTRDGRLPVVRLGRYYRYRLDAVEDFERGGGATATEAVANGAASGLSADVSRNGIP